MNNIKLIALASVFLSSFSLNAQSSGHVYKLEGAVFDTTKNVYVWTISMPTSMEMKVESNNIFVTDQANTRITTNKIIKETNETDEKGEKFKKCVWDATDESDKKCNFYMMVYEGKPDTVYMLVYKEYVIKYYVKN